MKRLLLLGVLLLAVAAFFGLGLQRYLSLEALKSGLGQFTQWRDAFPLRTTAAFFGLYVAVVALSLPGATLMTLAAGALFGLGWGLLLVSFASTVGATLAFWVSRYLLRDWVQQRFGARLKTINEGIEKEGAFYLFTLRLLPVFPFFVVNLLMGLTPLRSTTFYWVSQLGMLAGTWVFVNAGTQLANIERLRDVSSPMLLASFALLGVFPLLAKKALAVWQQRRAQGAWTKPSTFDRNLIVIGGGAAGLVAAYIAATVRAKVTLVEAHKLGGDCLNYGCVPSKALIRSAKLAHGMRHADNFGLQSAAPVVQFRELMRRIQGVIRRIEPHDSAERYTALGVDVRMGHARIVDPWTVEVTSQDGETRRITTRSIVIAAGARPVVPPLPGLEDAGYVTSDTLWDTLADMDAPPRRLVVLGGGPIGCELAQSFARLGSHVTQVEMGERLMAREDQDAAAAVTAALERDGVAVLTSHKALRCETERTEAGMHKFLVVEQGGTERRVEYDMLLCAVGRAARLEGYGLEELGIPTKRTVTTNDYLETLHPNIYAAGDVAGPWQFTHTASHQAWYAAVNALFGQFWRFKVDASAIPWATFTAPEVARVGINEQEAREQGVAHEVTRYALDDLDRAIADGADGAEQGFVKVLTVPGKDTILGVTIVGEHASEMLPEWVLAMKHGLGLNKILGTIHVYPTFSEASKYAAGEWKRSHAPERLLALAARYHAWRRG
ncbi:MAG: FAD-dependent oxidoreductase [Giesbergeria sp.]